MFWKLYFNELFSKILKISPIVRGFLIFLANRLKITIWPPKIQYVKSRSTICYLFGDQEWTPNPKIYGNFFNFQKFWTTSSQFFSIPGPWGSATTSVGQHGEQLDDSDDKARGPRLQRGAHRRTERGRRGRAMIFKPQRGVIGGFLLMGGTF